MENSDWLYVAGAIVALAVPIFWIFQHFKSIQNSEIERRTKLTDRVNEMEKKISELTVENNERSKRFYHEFEEIKKNQNELKVSLESFRSEMKTEIKHISGSKED